MSNQKKPGLRMEETLWGYFSEGIDDFEEGERKGALFLSSCLKSWI